MSILPLTSRRSAATGSVSKVVCQALATLVAFQSAALADTRWTNPGTGNWSSSANWNSGVPMAGELAWVVNGVAELSGGTGTSTGLHVGSDSYGLNGGARPTQLVVSGGATLRTLSRQYSLGELGGVIESRNRSINDSQIVVRDAGSRWINSFDLIVADYNAGTLSISNGGNVTVTNGYSYFGYSSGSSGVLNVTGVNSSFDSIGIEIGAGGTGTASVVNGGRVQSSVTTIGGHDPYFRPEDPLFSDLYHRGKGALLVSGSGSVHRAAQGLVVGYVGNGTLTVADGGLVETTSGPAKFVLAAYSGSQATLNIGSYSGGTTAGSITTSEIALGEGSGKINFNQTNAITFSTPIVLSGSSTGLVALEQRGSGSTTLTGNNAYAGGTTISAGTLAFASLANVGSGNFSVSNGTLRTLSGINFGTRTFAMSGTEAMIDTNGYNSTIGGVISGAGALEKSGAGNLTVTAANTYAGGTTVSEGVLQIGAGGTTGSISGNIENNAALVFNRSNDLTFAGIISGSGNLTKLGAGILTFTNINTYTGATFINAGTLTVMGGISGPGGLVTVAAGATLNGSGTLAREVTVNPGGTLANSLVLAGPVTLSNQQSVGAVAGGNATAASGQQLNVTTATGGTIDSSAGTASVETLEGATMNTGNWGATVTNLNSGTVNTSGGSVVAQQGNFNGIITGSGGLTKTGSGILTLSSANSYSGSTIVSDGTLIAAVGSATGSAPIRLVNNGKFRAIGNVAADTVVSESEAAIYEKVFGASENLENFGSYESNLGGRNTAAFFGAGSAGNGTTVITQFGATQTGGLLTSDTLSIDGLDGTTFLLVMNSALDIPENASSENFYLGWFDTLDNTWKNSVFGNHETAGSLAGDYSNTSYQSFLSSNGGWNASNMLGAYGFDAASNQVWAVIDHNSEFGVVPEPSTYALLILGGLAAVIAVRRKQRIRI